MIKIAQTTRELDDVYRVRYDVFIGEEQKFDPAAFHDKRIVDRFDTYPETANVIAYDEGMPVGALRISRDSELGIPADEYYDFSELRSQVRDIFSCSMLTIRLAYRKKVGLIHGIIRMATNTIVSQGGSHILVVTNADYERFFRHLGFTPVGEKFYSCIAKGDAIPMYNKIDESFSQFNTYLKNQELTRFRDNFIRMIYKKGETIFNQGEKGDRAYVIFEGEVEVFVTENGQDKVISVLKPGELFGELALIEDDVRSAGARARVATELMMLEKKEFFNVILNNPEVTMEVLALFSRRLRNATSRL